MVKAQLREKTIRNLAEITGGEGSISDQIDRLIARVKELSLDLSNAIKSTADMKTPEQIQQPSVYAEKKPIEVALDPTSYDLIWKELKPRVERVVGLMISEARRGLL